MPHCANMDNGPQSWTHHILGHLGYLYVARLSPLPGPIHFSFGTWLLHVPEAPPRHLSVWEVLCSEVVAVSSGLSLL